MPAPLAVDREAVRVLVLAVGVAEAARRTGLGLSVVKKWSADDGWLKGVKAAQSLATGSPTPARAELAATIPPSMRPQAVTAVTAGDALAEMMAEMERETRVSLAKAAQNLSKQAETAELSESGDALQAGKLAALVHRWGDGSSGNAAVINVLSSVSLTVEHSVE